MKKDEYGRKIKIRTYQNGCGNPFEENGKFVEDGMWADGHIAYSRLNDNDQVIEEEQGCYAQMRIDGQMIMYRI